MQLLLIAEERILVIESLEGLAIEKERILFRYKDEGTVFNNKAHCSTLGVKISDKLSHFRHH